MSLLDAARELDMTPLPKDDDGGCWFCGQVTSEVGHKGRCPWLSLPKIVAALGAAERVLQGSPDHLPFVGGSRERRCRYCDTTVWDQEAGLKTYKHTPDCPWQVLQTTLEPTS